MLPDQLEQLPAFRHLSREEYQDEIAALIWEIEAEGKEARNGNPVAGREKILAQSPYRPPTLDPQIPLDNNASERGDLYLFVARNRIRQSLAVSWIRRYTA